MTTESRPAGVHIRAARPEDHPGLRRIYDELDELHRRRAPWLFRQPESEPRPPAFLAKAIADPNHELLVALRRRPDDHGSEGGPDEIVGLAELLQRSRPDFPVFQAADYALIDTIAVRADARRLGIGRRLFESCLDRARERGLEHLELNVYEFNREALAFYEALGFQPSSRRLIGRTRDLAPSDERPRDA